MKTSRYTFSYTNSNPPVIANLLSGYEIVTGEALLRALRSNAFGTLDREEIRALADMNFITDNSRETVPIEHSAGELQATLCMTYACNLNCSYCVQSGNKRNHGRLDPGAVLTWLAHRLRAGEHDSVSVSLFGGEPVLESGVVSEIMSSLGTQCASLGISCRFGMTTNGTLLDPGMVSEWAGMGLESVDVTLDCPGAAHDANRTFHDGRGTFDVIVRNLAEISNLCDVNIISNFSPEHTSAGDCIAFAGELLRMARIASFRFKPFYSMAERHACFYSSRHGEVLREIWNAAENMDLPVERPFSNEPCGFFDNNSHVIGPDGEIYPCTPFLGCREMSLGNINDKQMIVAKKPDIADNLTHECLDCDYCPVCFGGCRFVSFQRHRDTSLPTCEKAFFNTVFSRVQPCAGAGAVRAGR